MSKATTGRRTGSARVNPIGTPSQAPAKAPPKIDLAARYQDCISGEPIGRDVPFEERERKLQKCWILSSNETETKVYKVCETTSLYRNTTDTLIEFQLQDRGLLSEPSHYGQPIAGRGHAQELGTSPRLRAHDYYR